MGLFGPVFKRVARMHALIAFEFELGVISLVLGATGLAKRFVDLVPDAMKSGILLGAGIAAVRLAERIGWPPLSLYLNAAPLVFAVYVVLFGELIQADALIDEAREYRNGDEDVSFDANRNNIICGIRNMGMSVLGPDASMCGPMWAAMQVVECERYKHGREAMDSLFGGVASFRWGTFTGYFFSPIVTLVKPILPIALSLTMLVQGYVAVRVGILKARTLMTSA